MKIDCAQDRLQNILTLAEKITGKNLNLPVLSCVYVEVKKNNLLLRATNLDLAFQATIQVKSDGEGVFAVPASTFAAIITNLQGEKNVTIDYDGLIVTIKSNKSKSVVKCINHEDFPTIPELSKDQFSEILAEDFINGLKAVWYSSSNSSIKPELSSVCVYPEDNEIIFAATDSFRLAEKKIKTKTIKDFEKILIPFKNIPEIIRVLEKNEGNLEVRFGKNQVAFVSNGIYLSSRVIDGTFPDYRQIIPKEFKTEAVVLKEDIVKSLKISTIFSDSFNQVNISITPNKKIFELTTRNASLGENTTIIDAAVSGESSEANFNFRYINDCLQSINSDSVSFAFAGPSRPVVIRGVADKSFTYLVMPMNR